MRVDLALRPRADHDTSTATRSQPHETTTPPSDFPISHRGQLYSYEVYAWPRGLEWRKGAEDTCDYVLDWRAFEDVGKGASPWTDGPRPLLVAQESRSRDRCAAGGVDNVLTLRASGSDHLYPSVILSDGESIRPHRIACDRENIQAAEGFSVVTVQFFCWVPDDAPRAEVPLSDMIRETPRPYRIVTDRAVFKHDHPNATIWQYQLIGNNTDASSLAFSDDRETFAVLRQQLCYETGEYMREPGSDLFTLWSSDWHDSENLGRLPDGIEDIRGEAQSQLDPDFIIPSVVHHFVSEPRVST